MLGNPYQESYYKQQHSTGIKRMYDLEESQRQYQVLLEQNEFLKQKLRNQNQYNNKKQFYIPQNKIYSPQQLDRYCEQKSMAKQTHNIHQQNYQYFCPFRSKLTTSKKSMICEALKQRNHFLERKIKLLKSEYEKQSTKIQKSYERFKNHSGCQKDCYQQQYYNLVKLTSPY